LIGDYFNEEARHKFMSLQGMSVAIGGKLTTSLDLVRLKRVLTNVLT
jgi:hypothetical protein